MKQRSVTLKNNLVYVAGRKEIILSSYHNTSGTRWRWFARSHLMCGRTFNSVFIIWKRWRIKRADQLQPGPCVSASLSPEPGSFTDKCCYLGIILISMAMRGLSENIQCENYQILQKKIARGSPKLFSKSKILWSFQINFKVDAS